MRQPNSSRMRAGVVLYTVKRETRRNRTKLDRMPNRGVYFGGKSSYPRSGAKSFS